MFNEGHRREHKKNRPLFQVKQEGGEDKFTCFILLLKALYATKGNEGKEMINKETEYVICMDLGHKTP